MKHLLLLIFATNLSLSVIAQDAADPAAMTFVENSCVPGSHKLEILEKDIPADLKTIIIHYRKAVADSMDWYERYSQEHNGEDPLPYHENFGITKVEYDRMNREFPLLKMKVRSTRGLTIKKADGQITFKGDGNFTIFDAVVFDINSKTLIIDGQKIPYTGQVKEGEASGIGAWQGYNWKLEIGSLEDIKAFKDADYTMIDLSMGKDQNNNTVLEYKSILIVGGEPKINGSLTAFLK